MKKITKYKCYNCGKSRTIKEIEINEYNQMVCKISCKTGENIK